MFRIKIANKIIQIHNHAPYVEHLCRDYLVKPGTPEYNSPCDLNIRIPSEVIKQEQQAGPQFSFGYCESNCIYREICRELLPYRVMLFHAAVISFDGEGYAFTAPPGTGKSTHISLWRQVFGERVQIINGDKPLLAYEESQDCFVAYGTPWCGKESWGCDSWVPLRKICFLKQGTENCIKKAEPEEIMGQLFHQVLFPEEEQLLEMELELLDLLLSRVAFYELTCNISVEAVQTAYNAMCSTDLSFISLKE